jgi:MerR family transcriptional regulator/heat shock protein HspR
MGPVADRPDGQRAVYVISVAAELAGMHPQTLRMYERRGLLHPTRTAGNVRRYSDADIDRLREIQRLVQEVGLNLAGVQIIMEMGEEVERLRLRSQALAEELHAAHERLRIELTRVARDHAVTAIVPRRAIAVSSPRTRDRSDPDGMRGTTGANEWTSTS